MTSKSYTPAQPARKGEHFLVRAYIGAGGSWATDDDKEKAIKRLGSIVVEDWGGIFDVEGKPLEVDVYSVVGDDRTLLETREITLPKRRAR